jgi:HD-GYP domain
MKLALLNDKIVGHFLEIPVYSAEGIIILNKGYLLSSSIISKLKGMGIGTVYINDKNYEDVVIQEALDSAFKLKAVKTLRQIFEQAKSKKDISTDELKDIVKNIIDNMDVSENSIISFDTLGDRKNDLCYHSLNVTMLSILLGISCEYNYSQLVDLGIGALIHDIGKLFSDGPSHTEEGYKLLREYRDLSISSYVCAYSHHENIDGTGYPRKVKGSQIYDYAKIVSICNEYDNLMHSADNLMPHEVLERISAGVGTKFEESLYKLFIKMIYCYPNGLPVKLNNGQTGVVIMQNKNFPQRPLVKVANKESCKYFNLMKELNLFVEEVSV